MTQILMGFAIQKIEKINSKYFVCLYTCTLVQTLPMFCLKNKKIFFLFYFTLLSGCHEELDKTVP